MVMAARLRAYAQTLAARPWVEFLGSRLRTTSRLGPRNSIPFLGHYDRQLFSFIILECRSCVLRKGICLCVGPELDLRSDSGPPKTEKFWPVFSPDLWSQSRTTSRSWAKICVRSASRQARLLFLGLWSLAVGLALCAEPTARNREPRKVFA